MGLEKFILNIILGFFNFFVKRFSIKDNQVAFISLESNKLEADMKLIYDELKKDCNIKIETVLIGYKKHGLKEDFLYMLNCIKQLFIINTSKVVIIRDNNYVVSTFKREEVEVIQVWHACGAIKKFGNALKRKYPIKNYDYVIANSSYWKDPYHEAFGVKEDNVVVTGMPRVDHLFDDIYLNTTRDNLLIKYPMLKDKRIILYAPTFRGNIYKGFKMLPFDGNKLIDELDDNTYLLYKFHPLLNNEVLINHPRIINVNNEDIHDLFTITDILISDYSSIVFDFAILEKPMYFYVPDLDEYLNEVGCYVDYHTFPGKLCFNLDDLISGIKNNEVKDVRVFKKKYFEHIDGNNTKRVVLLIKQLLNI